MSQAKSPIHTGIRIGWKSHFIWAGDRVFLQTTKPTVQQPNGWRKGSTLSADFGFLTNKGIWPDLPGTGPFCIHVLKQPPIPLPWGPGNSCIFLLKDWGSCWQLSVPTSALDRPAGVWKHRSSLHCNQRLSISQLLWLDDSPKWSDMLMCLPQHWDCYGQEHRENMCLKSNRATFKNLLISLAEWLWTSYFSS